MKRVITLIAVAILFASCDNTVYRCNKMIHNDKDCEKMKKYIYQKQIDPSKIEEIKKSELTESKHGRLLFCDECFSLNEYEKIKIAMKKKKTEMKKKKTEIVFYNEIQKLYNGLIKAGYPIGTEKEFREFLKVPSNRMELYNTVVNNGDFGIGSFDDFNKRIDYTFCKVKEDNSQSLQSKNINERQRLLYSDLSKYYKIKGTFEDFKKWFIVYNNREVCYKWLSKHENISLKDFCNKYAIHYTPAWYLEMYDSGDTEEKLYRLFNYLQKNYEMPTAFNEFKESLYRYDEVIYKISQIIDMSVFEFTAYYKLVPQVVIEY